MTDTLKSSSPNNCIHLWEIDAADGGLSYGVCRHCGYIKQFKNVIDGDSNYKNENAEAYWESVKNMGERKFRKALKEQNDNLRVSGKEGDFNLYSPKSGMI